jgi:hypothetical protein
MSFEPRRTVTYGYPLTPVEPLGEGHKAVAAAASKEASEREMAFLRDMSGFPTTSQRPPPELRQPALPNGFVDAMDAFDDEIFGRGVPVSRDKILALGRKRFQELLSLDRAARQEQRVIGPSIDLSSWPSVCTAFHNVGALSAGFPRRKTHETWTGAGEDRERAGQFSGFGDLWKVTQEPRAARAICAFRDKLETLVFGLSMLERCEDGKIHSKFFSSGKPTGSFTDWLSVLEQPHISVMLMDPIGDLIAWLVNEPTPVPRPLEYARNLHGRRAPSIEEIKITVVVWHAFVLGYTSPWDIWNVVGRETRSRTETTALEIWRNDLVRRYPAIEQFNNELRSFFYRPLGGNQFQFDERGHRLFINANLRKLANRLSAIVAMAVEEVLPQSVVARFSDSILAVTTDQVRHKAKLDASVFAKLQAAFPRSNFEFTIEA